MSTTATATAPSLLKMGCPANYSATLEATAIPADLVEVLTAIQGFSWTGLVLFVQKYAHLVPEMVAAFRGGFPGIIAFAVAHASEIQIIITDFLAIFGTQVTPLVNLP